MMLLCEYGCGEEAEYQFKNGKWCCCESYNKCSNIRKKQSHRFKGKNNPRHGKKLNQTTKDKISKSLKGIMVGNKNPFYGHQHNIKTKKQISNKQKGIKPNKETIIKMISSRLLTINKVKEKYPLFFKLEELRYNPNNINEKEIQAHCKNHKCQNSKEQDGWFTPRKSQLLERRRAIENVDGNGGHYLYCSDACKHECPLYNLHSDPLKRNNKEYTYSEHQQFREHVLNRDNHKCQYCDEKADHVHHERPQKLEPFHSLDPDYAWSVCKQCHYKYGHKDECSTGKLANMICF